jgi:glycosyltransferase involved in cell wall biosynthesis
MVFSTTNHSLVNREMMACGLPVVDLDVESVRHVFPENVLIKAKPDPNAIADALEHLLNESSYRDALREKGLDHIAGLSWESSSRIVEHAIVTRISESN